MEKKLVNLLVKKFMINFQQSQPKPKAPQRSGAPKGAAATEDRPPEIKGKEIGKMLAASSPPAEASRPGSFAPEKKATERKFQKINNVYADLL